MGLGGVFGPCDYVVINYFVQNTNELCIWMSFSGSKKNLQNIFEIEDVCEIRINCVIMYLNLDLFQ